MTFLAGVFFPLDSAPSVVQAASKVLPLTYLANGLRGVAVSDHSLVWTLPKLGVLAAFTFVIVAASLRSFRWTSL
jgi:ABC-2 type transport system permease protein